VYKDVISFATADLYGRVKVISLESGSNGLSVLRNVDVGTNNEQLVKQVVFNPDAKLLLVVSDQCAEAWSIDSTPEQQILATLPLGSETPYFLQHSSNQGQLLAFSITGVDILRWDDLSIVASLKYIDSLLPPPEEVSLSQSLDRTALARSKSPEECSSSIEKVHQTDDGTCFVLELSHVQQSGQQSHHFVTAKSENILQSVPTTSRPPLETFELPRAILTVIDTVFGLLSSDATASDRRSSAQHHKSLVTTSSATLQGDLLAFLDRELWVCTWPLSDSFGLQVKKHFFLPRELANVECLQLATVTRDGVLLCPRNGEVIVIEGGFKSTWVG
jgi:hypothetical protein